MSLISEQVEELRHESKMFHKSAKLYKLLSNAADTIEELSAKLSSANMERSEQHYKKSGDCVSKASLIKEIYDSGFLDTISQPQADVLREAIDYASVTGVVPVVRCKDCKQWGVYKVLGETDTIKCC